ncbi:ABC transporter permease [Streptomyces purpurogeneiscleroticus]|uniref:ABC transporter permease n=1 Tax=Streptomyces purpurogeneiscleroticus TaxID=68259 RepID=UPI001CBCE2ED|nr:ABC transporter permease [Streptomyces purpurogeneiscleroticus]MBZ4016042.1 ABC transporter permease [Streptomyces purpurogeneiscleroticus]
MLTAVRAIVAKDLLISRRSPTYFALSVVVPVMFVLLYAFIVQTATTAPIGFAVKSHGPHTQQFMSAIKDMKSEDGDAWEIRTTDPAEAKAMYDSGETIGMVVLPPTFEADVTAGKAHIDIVSDNINSDITKNLQLRVDTAIGAVQKSIDPEHTVGVKAVDRWASPMSFTRYMGASLLMFAILYASMVNTGSLVAREWEDRTAKAVVLSPRGLAPLIAGKWTAAFVQTCMTMVLVGLTLWLTLDYPLTRLGPGSWAPLLLMFLYGSALGVLLGVTLRRSLPLVPIAAVLAVVHFLVVGFESYMRGYAHAGLVEFLWQIARYWPVSGAIDQIRFTVEGQQPFYIGSQTHYLLWLSAVIIVLIGAATYVLRKRLRFAQGQ